MAAPVVGGIEEARRLGLGLRLGLRLGFELGDAGAGLLDRLVEHHRALHEQVGGVGLPGDGGGDRGVLLDGADLRQLAQEFVQGLGFLRSHAGLLNGSAAR
ncbi:MAG: hypothetical protein MO853_13755 [Candidatus Protistobacter heckmanni]|nr:hypothetical protein [Candidatus Protistobacter heckmanni]